MGIMQFAQSVSTTTEAEASPVIMIIYVAFVVLMLVSMWKVYTKAGKPGWAAIVPFYNTFVQLQIVGRPAWWFVLLLVPFVNIVIAIIMTVDLAKSFGKGTGFALLLLFLPFVGFPMLAFGDAQYQGPAAQS